MNRAEFMRRLAELLSDVPPTERDEALQYYNDYFDDAGTENESGVIASLGMPEELAKAIKAGLSDGGDGGEFTESGFNGYAQARRDEIMRTQDGARGTEKAAGRENTADTGAGRSGSGNAYYQDDYYRRTGGQGIYGGRQDKRQNDDPYSQQTAGNAGGDAQQGQTVQQKRGMSGSSIALIAILAVLTFPIWISAAAAMFGVAVSLLAVVFALFITFFVLGIAGVAVSIALFVTGCLLLFHAPLSGVCVIGTALILFAFGLMCVWLTVWCAVKAIPALFRGIAALLRRIFHRGGGRA